MASKVKLYDVFGELLYVLAMADGVIQEEEVEVLENMLAEHPWGKEIKWSFDYEVKQGSSIEELYKKVILFCQDYGPDPEYQAMLDVMEKMAAASAGIDRSEKTVIDSFSKGLTERFKRDIEKLKT
ncbi:MAG: TerB family tellurite resistance protein [Bacteroidota bacterium]